MYHLLFEDINSVLSEEYLEEKADVKAMIADFDRDALNNSIHNAIKELDPEAEVGDKLYNVITTVVGILQEEAPRIQDNFEREDRVVWAIKFLKLHLLCSVGSTAGTWYKGNRFTPDQMSVELFKNVFSKMNFMKKLQKTQGRDSVEQEYTAFGTGGTYAPLRIKEMLVNLLRYLETEIKPILDFVWDPKLTYTYLKRELEDIYEDYKKQLKGWAPVDEDGGDKIVIAYKSEKMYWFDLQRPSCSLEGDAAGHCGNSPRSNTNDNVYSLSTLKKVGKDWYRYPHITVVLEEDGLLGEIKGRGNTTPHDKYGDKLVDLCLLPEVDGIGEARWEEGENWMWDHFTEEQQKRILDVKPDFISSQSKDSPAKEWLNGSNDAESMREWLDEHVHLNYNNIINVAGDHIEIEYTTDPSDVYSNFENDISRDIGQLIYDSAQEEEEYWSIEPEDFAHEISIFVKSNASVRAGISNLKDKFSDDIDYGSWLYRHYANLRGFDKTLDKAIDQKFGTILNQKEFDFIEDNEATRAAWEKVSREIDNKLDIFDNNQFKNMLIAACRVVYETLKKSVYVPGDATWPTFETEDDIPFSYENITSKFYVHDFDMGWDGPEEYSSIFSSTLDEPLENILGDYDYENIEDSDQRYILDLWYYCFGEDPERYLDFKYSSADPDREDKYKKKRMVAVIYKAITGKNHPLHNL